MQDSYGGNYSIIQEDTAHQDPDGTTQECRANYSFQTNPWFNSLQSKINVSQNPQSIYSNFPSLSDDKISKSYLHTFGQLYCYEIYKPKFYLLKHTFQEFFGKFTELWNHGDINWCIFRWHLGSIYQNVNLGYSLDFPGGTSGGNLPVNAGDMRCSFHPWVGKSPWRRKWQPTPVFVPGEPHGQRSLAGCSPWGRRRVGHAEELDTTEWLIIQHTGTLYWAIQQLGKQRNALITHEGTCIRMLIRMLILNLVQKTVSNLNAHKKGKIIQEIENNLSKKRTFKINKWMNTWNSKKVLIVGKR